MTHGWLHEDEAPEAVDARATRITVELFDEGWRSTFRQLDALLEAQP